MGISKQNFIGSLLSLLIVGSGVAGYISVKEPSTLYYKPIPKIELKPTALNLPPAPQIEKPVAPTATKEVSKPKVVNNYPVVLASAPVDTIVDAWGMYNRECTSYTAWKVASTFGNMPNWLAYQPNPAPNANRWVILAQAQGIPTGTTPRVHSVAVSMSGYYGHTMWVEGINSDGSLLISQYNYAAQGEFSVADVSPRGLTFIYFGDAR